MQLVDSLDVRIACRINTAEDGVNKIIYLSCINKMKKPKQGLKNVPF